MNIRPYNEDVDYDEVCRWAKELSNEVVPRRDQFSTTSFMLVDEGENPLIVVSVLLTNAKRYCIPECLLTNPDYSPSVIKEGIELLSSYIDAFAKALEYTGVFCIAPNEILMRRYRSLGFRPTLTGVTTMMKELGG